MQVPPLVKAGFRVIAPDLRGALGGESDSPSEPEAYSIPKCIVKDVAGRRVTMYNYLQAQTVSSCPACFVVLLHFKPDRHVTMLA